MSDIDIEVEDPAWTAVPDVEAVVRQTATATLQFLLRGEATGEGDHAQRGGGGSAGPSAEPMNTGAGRALSETTSAGAAPSTTGPESGRRSPSPALRAEEELGSSVTILLTGDDEVADLNERFRHKPGPTNVLSFPAPPNPENHLGDIALAYGVCAREAAAQGKSLADHLRHLTVHGVLHLAGYDHQTDDEAQAMEALERRVLADLGVADPYADEQS